MDKEILREFLKASHVFAGELYPSNEMGISEGASLSPLLSNIRSGVHKIENGIEQQFLEF